jgi:glycosyltransferase involved in cell wall biosynthesis
MNVIFALFESEYNDTVWHALNLARALLGEGHDARIALAANSPIERDAKEAKLPVETILSAKSGFLAFLHQKETFKALDSRFKVDLFVSYGETPSGAKRLKNARFLNAVCATGEKIAWVKKAKRVVASSETVRADIIDRYGVRADRVFVVRGGLDPLIEADRLKFRAENRARFGLTKENVLIGILGEVSEESGHKLLIEALISDYHKNLKLIAVVSDDAQIVPFKNLCRQYNISRVTLSETVKRDDISFFSALDVGVIADLKPNGVARRAIELIAAGVSVVASKISADSEPANERNCYSEAYPSVLLNAIIGHSENDKRCDRASLIAAWREATKNIAER